MDWGSLDDVYSPNDVFITPSETSGVVIRSPVKENFTNFGAHSSVGKYPTDWDERPQRYGPIDGPPKYMIPPENRPPGGGYAKDIVYPLNMPTNWNLGDGRFIYHNGNSRENFHSNPYKKNKHIMKDHNYDYIMKVMLIILLIMFAVIIMQIQYLNHTMDKTVKKSIKALLEKSGK